MLRNLSKEIRDGLLASMAQKDGDIGKKITELMVIWEDIPHVGDRSLQQGLRDVDSQKLALALIGSEEAINAKIKSNISERAAATIEEETSLMSSPKKADIEEAREKIVTTLREMNDKGELDFMEE
jgi:flagellar motor switch protein FliG